MQKKTYDQFFEALGQRESSGNYEVINPIGYLGKYQMGKLALIDAGYYKNDGTKSNKFLDKNWTGKDGIRSKEEFLKNPKAQENAVRIHMSVQWKYVLNKDLDRYMETKAQGYLVTISGALAGIHLVGIRSLELFLKNGVIKSDGNEVAITTYIQEVAIIMAQNMEIDATIVITKTGNCFLKTPPDSTIKNNLTAKIKPIKTILISKLKDFLNIKV